MARIGRICWCDATAAANLSTSEDKGANPYAENPDSHHPQAATWEREDPLGHQFHFRRVSLQHRTNLAGKTLSLHAGTSCVRSDVLKELPK